MFRRHPATYGRVFRKISYNVILCENIDANEWNWVNIVLDLKVCDEGRIWKHLL